MIQYNPKDWHWIVAGDDSRAWSSAASDYVTPYPSDAVTRISSEAELNAVLEPHGLLGPDLAASKATAKRWVDAAAEAARLRYITPGSGQALEYREVQEEASRYVATNGAGQYPMLQSSVGAGEAADLAAAAAMVNDREAAWASIGAQIRQLRIAAKRGIAASTTVEQAIAAATVTWP